MAPLDFLVSTDWLAANYKNSDVTVLDGTWLMPGAEDNLVKGAIPGATFFDLDEIATPHPSLKHMLPGKSLFEAAMTEMGLTENDHVICYDRHGMFSAPRLWWTFRMFGHARVTVLNGG